MDFSHLSLEAISADPSWLLIQFLMTFAICFALGKIHEILHIYKAKKLGYKVISWTRFKNEVDIDIQPNDPNVRKIGVFPYLVLVPIGWLIVVLGWFLNSFGILLAGIATIIIHGLSIGKEGKT